MNPPRLVPSFLGEAGRRIFALLRAPAAPTASGVLLVPPFAEEMNKSRKMIADVANGLTAQGIGTLIVDPFGTGDSDGEFAESDWELWKADLQLAARWSASQGVPINALLGVRLGCALGVEACRESLPEFTRAVFWQPVLDGTRFLDQFLRLRVASSMMESNRKETIAELRQRLAAGEVVDVAGYALSPRLAAQIDRIRLGAQSCASLRRLDWVELLRSADAELPPPAVKAMETMRMAAVDVRTHVAVGPPFWSSVEIVVNPALVAQTIALFAT